MAEQNSKEIRDYQQGQWTVSERLSRENDRVDEGDHLDNGLGIDKAEDNSKSAINQDDSEVDSLKNEFAKDVLIF